MIGNKKEINAGDDSTNIQAQNVSIQQNGLSYSVVKEVAMDVFKSNFYDLGEKVEKLVNERAEEIINKYLKRLEEESPESLNNTDDPDVRYAIYEAQKNHARRGDKDVADLLVDLLIKRTTEISESFMKLVLDEALTVIPKLTTMQIDILSIIYMFSYLNFKGPIRFEDYYSMSKPFIGGDIKIPNNQVFYQHLQYTGCISISIGSLSFKDAMVFKFPQLLTEDTDKKLSDILSMNPELSAFKEKWDNTKLCNSSLTSVGIAIALSNINRKLGFKWDLDQWIKEE